MNSNKNFNSDSCFFSIVIPTFNDLGLLKNALDSVLKQTYKNFEVIIVDDSTTDDILKYFESGKVVNDRVIYLKNNPSKGAVSNWNYGISKANGIYIILLHHDEAFSTNNILNDLTVQLKENDYDCIILNKIVIKNGVRYAVNFNTFIANIIYNYFPSILYIMNIVGPCACVVFKKQIFIEFDSNLKWYVDVDWYYRLFRTHKIRYNDKLYIDAIFGHEHQISQNMDIKNQERKDMFYLKKRTSFFNHLLIVFLIRDIYSFMKFNLLNHHINPIYSKE